MQTVGRHHSVDRWLAMLPRDLVLSNGPLCLLSATISVAMGEGDEALIWLKFADQAVADAADPGPVGLETKALRSMLVTSDIDGTFADADEAYVGLPAGRSHALACLSRGLLSFVRGDDAGRASCSRKVRSKRVWSTRRRSKRSAAGRSVSSTQLRGSGRSRPRRRGGLGRS